MSATLDKILDRPLVVVTGKGGVGKTTVAAALGIAAAQRGLRTIVCEVAGQTRLPALLGPAPSGEARPDTLSLDPIQSLGEWLGSMLPSRLAQILSHSGTFGAFVAAAPGSAELVAVTKAWELGHHKRWRRDQRPYDVVILDAPASGHGVGMLQAPQTYASIARVGPIASQARAVAAGLGDAARTAFVGVAIPTELAVTETLELSGRLEKAIGRDLDVIVCNGVVPRRISAADARAAEAAPRWVARAAKTAVARGNAQQSQLARLRKAAQVPVSTLPYVFSDGLTGADVASLSNRL